MNEDEDEDKNEDGIQATEGAGYHSMETGPLLVSKLYLGPTSVNGVSQWNSLPISANQRQSDHCSRVHSPSQWHSLPMSANQSQFTSSLSISSSLRRVCSLPLCISFLFLTSALHQSSEQTQRGPQLISPHLAYESERQKEIIKGLITQ